MLIYFKDSSYRLMKIAVIGSGNMGGALVRGLVASGAVAPQDIICTGGFSEIEDEDGDLPF